MPNLQHVRIKRIFTVSSVNEDGLAVIKAIAAIQKLRKEVGLPSKLSSGAMILLGVVVAVATAGIIGVACIKTGRFICRSVCAIGTGFISSVGGLMLISSGEAGTLGKLT